MNEEFMYDLREYNYTHFEKAEPLIEEYINIGFYIFLLFQPVVYFFGFRAYQRLTKLFEKEEEEEKEKEKEEEEKLQIKYEDKYIDEYNKVESQVLSKDDLDRLKNTFLMERTPLGNLMMHYDHTRESFVYYSDNTIPYRFLEVASRRYVVQNNCKSIHVNMKDELSEAEKRSLDKKEKEKEKTKEHEKKQETEVVKKSVFAKLKNYNTASTRAPNEMKQKTQQQNSNRPNAKSNVTINNDSNIIVKEKANRYSNEGKFANFSFLKKIDKKTVDKRYKMSFADFKKL